MTRILSRASLVLAAVALCAGSARAATIEFSIYLDGLQETPPVATPATGTGSLFLDDVSGAYTISGSFQDLIGTSNNAHIHGPAAVGAGPAGVVVGLTFDFGVTSGDYSGAGVFTPAQMAELIDELYYVNIHSTFRPGGEIRGQIVVVPEPAGFALVGLGLVALGTAARLRRRASW
jgi:hypothetical protein